MALAARLPTATLRTELNKLNCWVSSVAQKRASGMTVTDSSLSCVLMCDDNKY
jgi:hypothetical protein